MPDRAAQKLTPDRRPEGAGRPTMTSQGREPSPGGARARAVVSGGAGFIGSHLCEALLDAGMSVLALDNLLTGSPDNVRELLARPDFEFRKANVNDEVDVDG